MTKKGFTLIWVLKTTCFNGTFFSSISIVGIRKVCVWVLPPVLSCKTRPTHTTFNKIPLNLVRIRGSEQLPIKHVRNIWRRSKLEVAIRIPATRGRNSQHVLFRIDLFRSLLFLFAFVASSALCVTSGFVSPCLVFL